jgi:hypothetical protein
VEVAKQGGPHAEQAHHAADRERQDAGHYPGPHQGDRRRHEGADAEADEPEVPVEHLGDHQQERDDDPQMPGVHGR